MKDQSPEYLQGNIDAWQKKAADYVESAEEAWASDHPSWGIWGIPENSARLLPEDMSGLNAIELGCGTAYVSAWMHRRGAKVVAILVMSASIWSTLDFVTPGRFPDAFAIGEIVVNAVVKHNPGPSDSPSVVVYHDDWFAVRTDDQLLNQTQVLDTSDPEQLAALHFVPESSGVAPEVFENGRVIKVSAQNFLNLSDEVELA